jgi:negative regulator of sigma E activity
MAHQPQDSEARLEQLAQRLGQREADGIDPQKVAWRVMARLRQEPARRPWWSAARLVPLAAAATIVLAAGFGLVQVIGGPDVPVEQVLPVDVADLEAEQLEEVLDSLSVETPVAELVTVGLYDLSENELEQLLQSMDSMEG